MSSRLRFRVGLLLALSCMSASAMAQKALIIVPLDAQAVFFERFRLPANVVDSTDAARHLTRLIADLKNQSFLTASVDSIITSDSSFTAQIFVGRQYSISTLGSGNLESELPRSRKQPLRKYANKRFNYLEINKLKSDVLEQFENRGYPFAQVWLDSLLIVDDQIGARVYAQRGRLVTFGNVTVQGDLRLSENFLRRYLDVQRDQPFDRSKIMKMKNRLKELPYVQQKEDVRVEFVGDRSDMTLFLDRKRASRFDFLIGVLPNNTELGRLLVTGSFNGEMHNQFGYGERLFAAFENLRPDTRRLDLAVTWPYVFTFPFGLDLQFSLYKRDTSYLDVFSNTGLQYNFSGQSWLKAFWQQANSSLLSIDSATIVRTRKLPRALDVTNTSFGLEYTRQTLDYRFNPRRGWSVSVAAIAGLRRVKPNRFLLALQDATEPTFDFSSLYDTLQLQTFQYRLHTNIAHYLPLFSSQTLKTSLQAATILASTPVFFNEQYRIGGNRLLRGFDEEAIFATSYAVLTNEWRFLTAQNSYLFAFNDIAWVSDKTNFQNTNWLAYAFGAGLTLETNIGIFGISYALGASNQSPLNIRAGKVHFGYVSMF